jgi:hypothetical protein
MSLSVEWSVWKEPAGILADTMDIPTTMLIVSGLSFVAAITVAMRVKETVYSKIKCPSWIACMPS